MASDLKLDLVITISQRGPNVQLMGNPAVLKTHKKYTVRIKTL